MIDEHAAVAVHALCARLDGIPLALELAAAQTAMMTPTEIERRLDKQFRLASGGRRTALERHQTLRAAIDWSYELLSPGAQQVLPRCSVCVGGFDLEAATALASGIDAEHGDGFDLLRELVAKSLVERYEVNGATRYRLLEMIRQYAAEQLLSAGDDATARDLHAAHYLARTVELVTEALTVAEYEALETLGLETPNIAAGARWLLAEQRAAEVMAMFAALPFLDWFVLPAITLDELGAIAEETVTQDRTTALDGFGTASMLASFLLYWQGDMERYQRLGDLARSAPDPTASPSSPIYDSVIAMMAGDTEQGAATAARAAEIARAKADPALLAWTLAHYAIMQSTLDYATSDDARSLASSAAEEALALARRQPGTTVCLYPLSAIVQVHHLVDPERSLEAVREIKRIDHSQRKWWLTIARNAAITLPNANAAESLTEWRAVLVDSHEWTRAVPAREQRLCDGRGVRNDLAGVRRRRRRHRRERRHRTGRVLHRAAGAHPARRRTTGACRHRESEGVGHDLQRGDGAPLRGDRRRTRRAELSVTSSLHLHRGGERAGAELARSRP